VIEFYNTRDVPPTSEEIDARVAFLETLTDGYSQRAE